MKVDRSRWDGIAHEVFGRLREHYTKAGIADAEARAEAFAESRFRERCQAKLDAWIRSGGPVPSGHATDRGGLLALWRALGLEDDSGAVLTGLAAWKGSERWREGYVVKARKFLEERHWEVPPPAPKAKPQALGGAW